MTNESSNWIPLTSIHFPLSTPLAPPSNTRTAKTAWKKRRRLANAPKSVQKRMLKRM